MARLLGVRAYARHFGVTHQAVRKAIQSGRITLENGKIDPVVADREWVENTNPMKRRGAAAESDPELRRTRRLLLEAQAIQAGFRAKLARLEYERLSATLVSSEDVRVAWARIATIIRAKVLAVPARFKARAPHVSDEDVRILEEVVREAVEGL